MPRGSNLPRVSVFNRAVILEAIRSSQQGRTRAQLGRLTRLAPQTVSNVTRQLLESGLVEEAGVRSPGGRGRPGTRLRLRPTARFAVGVHLDPARLGIVAADLAGEVIADLDQPLPSPDDPEAVTRHLAHQVETVVRMSGLPRHHLLGVGVAAPGPLDEESGTVSPPLLPGWDRIPLRTALAEQVHSTVLLDKDVIAAAKAHLWHGAVTGTTSYAFLYVGAGVALATVLGGEVVRGTTGNAGEAGHFPADPDGPRCRCGRRGCLGAAVGEIEMLRLAGTDGLAVWGTQGPRTRTPQAVNDAFERLVSLADDGQEAARAIFEQAGRSIAAAAGSWSELLDVATLVIGGPAWEQMRHLVEPVAAKILAQHRVHGAPAPVRVVSSPFSRRVGALGAACLVLDEVYTPRSDSLLITP